MSEEKARPKVDLEQFGELFDAILDQVSATTGAGEEKDLTLPDNPVAPGELVISPERWAAKQTERAARAGDDWLYGVLHPRRNPVTAAIAANDKRKDRLAKSEQEEKWLKSMQRVDVDEMYRVIEEVGQSAYEAGVRAREGKARRRIDEMHPMVVSLKRTIQEMSDATDADREKRMIAAKRGMQAIGRKLRGIG